MRINIISENILTLYKYCNNNFHDEMIKLLHEHGIIKSKTNQSTVFEIDEESYPAKILNAIDELIDLEGAQAIEWINSINWKTLSNISSFKQPKPKILDPSKYVEHLTKIGNDSLNKLEANPTAKILKKSHSFDEVDKAAISYLEEINYSKRVHISYDPIAMLNFAWVKV